VLELEKKGILGESLDFPTWLSKNNTFQQNERYTQQQQQQQQYHYL